MKNNLDHIVLAICLVASLSTGSQSTTGAKNGAGDISETQCRGLVCRGVEEVGGLLIGQPNFPAHLITLFAVGENPLIGTHTMAEHVAWANDPLHSYVPDGTGCMVVWAHPAKSDAQGILNLPGLAGVEVQNVAVYGASNGISRDGLWDEVLTGCHDRGRPFIWAFAADDTHSTRPGRFNLSWYAARIPEMDEFALKTALREGAFYVSNGPGIENVSVKGKTVSLKLDENHDVLWLRDGQYVEESGFDFDETLDRGGNRCLREDRHVAESSLDLRKFLEKDEGIKFVRAVVWKNRSFVALTQPWRIHADGSIENPYPADGIWVRGQTHNHTDALPSEKDGKRLKKYRLAYQSVGQLANFSTDYSYREAPYQWLESDGTPQIESVVPAHGRQGEPMELVVKGVNFEEGCVVQLNEHVVPASLSNGLLKVDVLGDLPAGKYDLTITNAKGFRGNKPFAVAIREGNASLDGWKNFTVAEGLAHPHNTCIATVGDEVWVGSMWGVSQSKEDRWQVFRDEIPNAIVYDIQPDAKGGLWMSGGHDTTRGIIHCDPEGKWSTFEVGDEEGLAGPDALERWGGFALEKDGTLWAANRWRGGMAVRRGGKWDRLTIQDDGLPGENPSAIGIDASGRVWAGFLSGLHRLSQDGWERVSLPGNFNSLNYAYAIAAGPSGEMWVSMAGKYSRQGGGVLLINGEDITVYTPENSPLPSRVVRDILVDRNGNVWFASDLGVAMLDTKGKWHSFTTLNSGLGCDIVQALAEDGQGRIWFATTEGVDC
ncbi:MAG: two-component regulator propeller domain-containing protein, partial [Verrucomicrobiota bacterium]